MNIKTSTCKHSIFIQGDEDTQDKFNCDLTGKECDFEKCILDVNPRKQVGTIEKDCRFLYKDKVCVIGHYFDKGGRCEENHTCYFKQLQREKKCTELAAIALSKHEPLLRMLEIMTENKRLKASLQSVCADGADKEIFRLNCELFKTQELSKDLIKYVDDVILVLQNQTNEIQALTKKVRDDMSKFEDKNENNSEN